MFNFFMSKRNRCRRRSLIYTLLPYDRVRNIILNDCSKNDGDSVLIDLREKREYDVMHVVNSINIPVAKLRFLENEYKNKKNIILYCSTGSRTKEAIMILNNMGYNNLYIWEYGALGNFPYKDMIVL